MTTDDGHDLDAARALGLEHALIKLERLPVWPQSVWPQFGLKPGQEPVDGQTGAPTPAPTRPEQGGIAPPPRSPGAARPQSGTSQLEQRRRIEVTAATRRVSPSPGALGTRWTVDRP
jgi:hypothetical protein